MAAGTFCCFGIWHCVDYRFTAFAPNMLWLFVGITLAGLVGIIYDSKCLSADITKPEDRAKVFRLLGGGFWPGILHRPENAESRRNAPCAFFPPRHSILTLLWSCLLKLIPESRGLLLADPIGRVQGLFTNAALPFERDGNVLATSVYRRSGRYGHCRFKDESTIGLTLAFGLIRPWCRGLDWTRGK